MAEAAPTYGVRVQLQLQSRGTQEGTNRVQQVVGGGITIPLTLDSPLENVIEINQAQLAGLFGYIGLLDANIDTSAVETAIATLVAAS